MILIGFGNSISKFNWSSEEYTFCPRVIISNTSFDAQHCRLRDNKL